MKKPRVIIIGAGVSGVEAAKRLKNANVNILLIDQSNHHLFQPFLYQVATGALSEADIAIPLRELFSRQKNVEICMATVSRIDKEKKKVVLGDETELSYDYLVVATGARHSYFGHKEWEPYAPGLKSISDTMTIRDRLIQAFEKAERWHTDPEEVRKNLTFVVVGAGPTGVEIAGGIAETAFRSLAHSYRNIDSTKAKIYLVDALPRILPAFPDIVSQKAKKALEELHVTVMTNTLVKGIGPDWVDLSGKVLPAGTIIWAAGNEASPLLKTLNTPLDKAGRAIVQKDLTIAGYPELFVIGDASCAFDMNNHPLPGFVPIARQEGRYVASLIERKLPAEKRPPFLYQ